MGTKLDRAASVAFIVASLCIAGSIVYRTVRSSDRPQTTPPAPTFEKTWLEAAKLGRALTGSSTAPITIVELTDLECPICREFQPELMAVASKYPAEVKVIYVPFPLVSIHRFALSAARAAECAASTEKLLPWIESVYAKQDSLGIKSWASFAADAGIRDTSAISSCAMDPRSVTRIDSTLAYTKRIGINSTPTIFINGWRLRAAHDRATLDSVVQKLLRERSLGASK